MRFSRTSTRPIAVGVAVCLAAGFLGGGVASASIGEVAKAPAPTNCRKASGPFKVSGIKVLGAKGKVFVPYGTTVTGMAPGTNDSPDPTSAEQQITGAYKYWCVNTVRIQVSQESLVGKSGASFSSGFLAQLKHVVSVAEGYGLVVVISDQTETAGLQPGPTAATASFWQHLAKTFGGSKQVIFDLFNEPRVAAGSTSRDWQVWQRGGTVKGVAYIGMKSLVADVRGDGARNLFWVEGPFSASTLAQAGSHLVGDRAGVVYDIHHPGGAHDAAVNALTQLFGARLQADLARYATAAEIIVLPAVNPRYIPLTSFTHASELVEQALTAARTALAAHDTHPALARAS